MTCVHPGGSENEEYYIQFQVWRLTSTVSVSDDECYELVGSNTPQDGENMEEFLSPLGDGPLNRCVVLPVREDRQIEFQSGDVVGYYVDHDDDNDNDNDDDNNDNDNDNDDDNNDDNDDDNDNDDGMQWIEDHDNVVVHFRDNLRRNGIQSYYAIGGTNPTECGFPISGDCNFCTLADSTSAAPIISLSIGKSSHVLQCNVMIQTII